MNHPHKVYTPETDAAFAPLWTAGDLSCEDLAKRFGVSLNAVYDWRVRLGLPARVGKHKQEVKTRICDLWKQGFSAGEIARIIGKSRNAIMGVVKRSGLSNASRAQATRPLASKRTRQQVTFTPQMDADLRKMAGEGISRATAARRLGVSGSRVCDRVKVLLLQWQEPTSGGSNPWSKSTAKLTRTVAERQAALEAGQALLAAATDEPGPHAVRMLDRRTFGQCAWPVGTATGADQLCCGQPIGAGHTGIRQSYCAGHGMKAVSRTFARSPEPPKERRPAPVPRREPANDDLWDVAA